MVDGGVLPRRVVRMHTMAGFAVVDGPLALFHGGPVFHVALLPLLFLVDIHKLL